MSTSLRRGMNRPSRSSRIVPPRFSSVKNVPKRGAPAIDRPSSAPISLAVTRFRDLHSPVADESRFDETRHTLPRYQQILRHRWLSQRDTLAFRVLSWNVVDESSSVSNGPKIRKPSVYFVKYLLENLYVYYYYPVECFTNLRRS